MFTCTCCKVGLLPRVALPFVRMYWLIFCNVGSDCIWVVVRVVEVVGTVVEVWVPIGSICPLSRTATP